MAAPRRSRAELVLSLGVLALGLGAAVVAWRLPEAGGYARIGPNFMPKFVSGALVLLGIWLLGEAPSGFQLIGVLFIIAGLLLTALRVRSPEARRAQPETG